MNQNALFPAKLIKLFLANIICLKVIIFYNLMILEVVNPQKYMQLSFGYEKA